MTQRGSGDHPGGDEGAGNPGLRADIGGGDVPVPPEGQEDGAGDDREIDREVQPGGESGREQAYTGELLTGSLVEHGQVRNPPGPCSPLSTPLRAHATSAGAEFPES
jgi:hypothetical protein